MIVNCPIHGCSRTCEPPSELPVEVGAIDTALGLAPGTMLQQALFNRALDAERFLEEHLRSHSVLDWAKTVGTLTRQLAEVRKLHKGDGFRMCGGCDYVWPCPTYLAAGEIQ